MARKRKDAESVPSYDKLMIPVLNALVGLGGSGTIEEINEKVYELEKFSEEVLEISHGEAGSVSEIDYRLAWARTYLKKFGLLENSARGVWNLVDSETDISKINSDEIVRHVRNSSQTSKVEEPSGKKLDEEIFEEVEDHLEWKEKLLKTILSISPSAFERLVQRLLRESGFVEVDVTGGSSDGGIDGKGIVRLNGFLSFHIIFQCKRYISYHLPM